MMFPILTDEQLHELSMKLPEGSNYVKEWIQAQVDQDLKNFVKWGDEMCLEHHHLMTYRRECIYCWAELRKLAGME